MLKFLFDLISCVTFPLPSGIRLLLPYLSSERWKVFNTNMVMFLLCIYIRNHRPKPIHRSVCEYFLSKEMEAKHWNTNVDVACFSLFLSINSLDRKFAWFLGCVQWELGKTIIIKPYNCSFFHSFLQSNKLAQSMWTYSSHLFLSLSLFLRMLLISCRIDGISACWIGNCIRFIFFYAHSGKNIHTTKIRACVHNSENG